MKKEKGEAWKVQQFNTIGLSTWESRFESGRLWLKVGSTNATALITRKHLQLMLTQAIPSHGSSKVKKD